VSRDPELFRRASALFDRAVELTPAERLALLDSTCSGDAALRAEVESLLDADGRAAGLEGAAAARAAPLVAEALADEESETLGSTIGPYRILSELGRGGMGRVFLAERADGQFEHRVAVKLVNADILTADARRRFLLERQILARLEHPHIARLHDGGVSATGQPWYAMEVVDGLPITLYCDEHRLGIEARLGLFLDVCSAVGHAHRSLVVHRDLKPSNILVDGAGTVKLLDFGIAKLLDPEGAAAAGHTVTSFRVLTPEYAAPEQFRGEPVTTAADVWALGVLLYDLICGRRPYRVGSETPLADAAARLSRDAARPSSVVEAPAAASRGISLPALRRRLRGDLDTIALAALRPDAARRYSSVEALQRDVERHLAGRPVAARSDSAAYRTAKFVHRHRLGVAAAGFVVLALVAGMVTALWQARAAARQARRAEEVKGFLASMFQLASPSQARGRTITVRDLLDEGASRVIKELAGEPEVEAELLSTIGQTYIDLGVNDRAAELLAEAFAIQRRLHGEDSLEAAGALRTLAAAEFEAGDFERSGQHFEEVLALQTARLGRRDVEVAHTLNEIAGVYRRLARFDRAEKARRESLALYRELKGNDDRDTLNVSNDLGVLLRDRGDFPGAETTLRDAWERGKKSLGEDDPDVLSMHNNLAVVLAAAGRYEEAEGVFREVLPIRRRVLGEDHPHLALAMRALANVLDRTGRSEEALPLLRQALDLQRRAPWGSAAEVGNTQVVLARVLHHHGEDAEALELAGEGVDTIAERLGRDHPLYATALLELGTIQLETGHTDQAATTLRDVLALRRRIFGPENIYTRQAQALVDRLPGGEGPPATHS
jgi:serine/threonine-protein kinase